MHTPSPPSLLSAQVAAELRAELARQKLSTTSLASWIGCPRSWVARRLSGEVLTIDDLSTLTTALHVQPSDLLRKVGA